MVAVPHNGIYTGSYNESHSHDVKSIPDCQAACLADAACVQITWAPTHPDKCVVYYAITSEMTVEGDAQGWTKCNASSTDPATCAPIVYEAATYGDGTQTCLTYALYLGAVPAANDADVFASLIKAIYVGDSISKSQCTSQPCLTTGIIATKWIMELLSIRGRTDVGLDLAFKTDYPSWGYMAAMNATTVWEHWEYMNGSFVLPWLALFRALTPPLQSLQFTSCASQLISAGPGMNSHAHPAFASVGAWFYRWVAGLRLDDGTLQKPTLGYGQGWRRVLFSPGCVTDPRLPAVQARVSSMYGPIEVSWANVSSTKLRMANVSSTKLRMSISLPPDANARVVIPSHVGKGPASVKVTEGGVVIWQGGQARLPRGSVGIESVAVEDGCVTAHVGSGN
jgi:alpha-L-rhamnosidase